MSENNENDWRRRRTPIVMGVVILFLLLVILVIYLVLSDKYESTDDAYVSGNQVVINPQISGIVTQIGTDDTYFVQKGALLVSLDETDRTIELNLKREGLANTCRQVVNLFEEVKQRQAEVDEKKATLINSTRDYEHRKELLPEGAVSLEEFQRSQTQYLRDYSLLTLSTHELEAAQAKVSNTTVLTHPQVKEAIDSFKQAYVDLKRCQILSPVDGIVAQRKVQVGQWVNPGTGLMNIIPLEQMWVDANFREVQLKNIRIGQPVTLRSDMYGSGIQFEGIVKGIGIGTGSVFSVLPPQNATGNWIKIVQRLPVRITIEREQLAKHPLRLGLSMTVKVDLENQKGGMIPKGEAISYTTDVFQNQEEGFDLLLEEIILQNIPPYYRMGQ